MWIRICSLLLALAGSAEAQGRRPVPMPEQDAEATFEVEAVFSVLNGDLGSSETGPPVGIHVELGVGEQYSWFGAEPVLGRAVSDEQGAIRVTLAVPLRWRGEAGAGLWARVVEPGCQRREGFALFESERVGRPGLLLLIPGGTLPGSLRDGRGQPVAGAEVILYSVSNGIPGAVGSRSSDEEGHFALHYAASGTYELHARASGIGSARVPGVTLDTQLSAEPIELELLGGVALTGRVLDSEGYPVPGLIITALPGAQLPTGAQRYAAESAGGLLADRARTDRAGRFKLPSMLPGEYMLHASYEAPYLRLAIDSSEMGARLGQLSAPTTEEQTWIHTARRLEVEVVDHGGVRLDAEQVSQWNEKGGRRLTVVPAPTPRDSRQHEVRPFAVGCLMVYPVEPGREYIVAWSEESVLSCEQRVRVEQHSARLPVRLTLPAPAQPARLAVRVLNPDGWPFTGPCEVVVSSAESGRRIAKSKTSISSCDPLPEAIWSTSLPSGRYRIQVREANATWSTCGNSPPPPRLFHLPGERTLDLRPGEQLHIDLQLGAAGHLDFEPPPEARPAVEDDSLVFATVTLTRSGGTRRIQPEFLVTANPRFVAAIMPSVVQGLAAQGRTPIPVGEWIVRAESDDRVLLERAVTIRTGQVTRIRW